jgi:hypothetical protein
VPALATDGRSINVATMLRSAKPPRSDHDYWRTCCKRRVSRVNQLAYNHINADSGNRGNIRGINMRHVLQPGISTIHASGESMSIWHRCQRRFEISAILERCLALYTKERRVQTEVRSVSIDACFRIAVWGSTRSKHSK